MCGIVGYVGPRPAIDVLVSGLERLEYRGYDSAGLAIHDGDVLAVVRRAGRIADLVDARRGDGGAEGSTGIGHTRWATHGAPTTRNAHPHGDCAQQVAVAHNGIIENWMDLKDALEARGHVFSSDTDTEVVAHLIEEMADLPLAEAVRQVMEVAEGALALAVVRRDEPQVVVGARRGARSSSGWGMVRTSSPRTSPAFLSFTRTMLVIDDDRVVEVRPDSVEVTNLADQKVTAEIRTVEWDLEAAEKGGYRDFMLKEIHEQPKAIADTLAGRVDTLGRIHLDELALDRGQLRGFDKVFVVACGTSYHAALMAKYAIERWTRMPVETDIASEFRYRDGPRRPNPGDRDPANQGDRRHARRYHSPLPRARLWSA